jgi:hypothetical protein
MLQVGGPRQMDYCMINKRRRHGIYRRAFAGVGTFWSASRIAAARARGMSARGTGDRRCDLMASVSRQK